MVVPVKVEPAAKATEATTTRTTWKARVVDLDKVPRRFLTVNQAALDAIARGTRGSEQIEGVEFYSESSLVFTG